jgi:hypothetical protein
MPSWFNPVIQFARRIGSCPKCMHEAFLAAAVSWGMVLPAGVVVITLATNVPLIVTALLAGLLTLLWVLHLLVFSIRAMFGTEAQDGSVPATIDVPLLARRAFIGRFVSIFAGAALATGFSRQAFAQSQWYVCNTSFCGGKACCPTSHPILNHCTCRCFRASNEFDCGSYSQCNLDGSDCR